MSLLPLSSEFFDPHDDSQAPEALPALSFQIQADKEKLLYELDNLQSQLDKAQLSSNRFQTEKEDFQLDADRQREKCDKLQVGRKPSRRLICTGMSIMCQQL